MALALESTTQVDTINPGNYSVYQFKNPINGEGNPLLKSETLKVTVVDSTTCVTKGTTPIVAAMFVPKRRELDYIFCTPAGYRQLMAKFLGISRIILVGNFKKREYRKFYTLKEATEEQHLTAVGSVGEILEKFIPAVLRNTDDFQIPFLKYDDGLIYGENIMSTEEREGCLGIIRIDKEITKHNGEIVAKKVV